MTNYIKAEQIAEAQAELKLARKQQQEARDRMEKYRGQSRDILEHSRLRSEQVRLVDLIMDLKDAGKVVA